MTATAPIALELLEDALAQWIKSSTGADPYHVEPEDAGAPIPAPPAAQMRMLSLVAIGQPEIRKIPSIVQHRWTVTAAGPGTVGGNFYLGAAETPSEISIAAGPGDPPATSALALLAELAAELPAGYAAVIDPEDDASVLIDGTAAEPLFAAAPVDPALLAVQVRRERYPELEAEWSRMTWRIRFRTLPTRGFGSANDLMIRAKKSMHRILRPLIHAAGWQLSGVLAMLPDQPDDRSEGVAALDFAIEGYSTAAYQSPAARTIGIQLTA